MKHLGQTHKTNYMNMSFGKLQFKEGCEVGYLFYDLFGHLSIMISWIWERLVYLTFVIGSSTCKWIEKSAKNKWHWINTCIPLLQFYHLVMFMYILSKDILRGKIYVMLILWTYFTNLSDNTNAWATFSDCSNYPIKYSSYLILFIHLMLLHQYFRYLYFFVSDVMDRIQGFALARQESCHWAKYGPLSFPHYLLKYSNDCFVNF